MHMYHIVLIHSSVDGHLGCYHALAIFNSAAIPRKGKKIKINKLINKYPRKGTKTKKNNSNSAAMNI